MTTRGKLIPDGNVLPDCKSCRETIYLEKHYFPYVVELAPFLPLVGAWRDTSMEATDRSLLIDEAAAVLGVSRRTVYYRIREGKLRTIRTRCGSQRVLQSSIEKLLGETRRVLPPEADAATVRGAAV